MQMLMIVAAALMATATAASLNEDFDTIWEEFKTKYNKTYKDDAEEKDRMDIFREKRKMIDEHNAKFASGEVTYKKGINLLSDLLDEEVEARRMGFKAPSKADNQSDAEEFVAEPLASLPSHIDWRQKGAVTHVEDQGECGSCYAFSSNGALEGQHFKKTGKLVALSNQQIVDCSRRYGNRGCRGGYIHNTFTYIRDNRGVNTEESYPYYARDGRCRFDRAAVAATDSGYKFVRHGDEQSLKQAVANIGPISVGIQVTGDFLAYDSGVFYDPYCSRWVNHAVLVVGYGTANGRDYWLVKNSWGRYWGESGYVRMSRNDGNNCYIASYATYPIV